MAVPVPPPLLVPIASRREGHGSAIGRWGGLELVSEAVGAHGHGSATFDADTEEVVLTANVVRATRKVDPAAVSRPGIQLLGAIVEGQAFEIARSEREHVDVAVAGSGRNECEARAIGRIEWARFIGGVRDQEVGLAALRGCHPNVAARNEGNLRAGGTQSGLGEIRNARPKGTHGTGQQQRETSHGLNVTPCQKRGACRSRYCETTRRKPSVLPANPPPCSAFGVEARPTPAYPTRYTVPSGPTASPVGTYILESPM
jgi:hypothetical protein